MNLERSLLSIVLWPVHRGLLRLTGGRAGIAEPTDRRMGTLLLTTTGHRTGAARSVPTFFMRDGQRLVIVASNAGDDRQPAWYLNLPARARDAAEGERARLWPELVRRFPAYDRYERRTRRQMPVVILEPGP